VLGDNVSTFALIITIALTCHVLILNGYRYLFNRKYYRALRQLAMTGVAPTEMPMFRSLPGSLVFPRFQIMLGTVRCYLELYCLRTLSRSQLLAPCAPPTCQRSFASMHMHASALLLPSPPDILHWHHGGCFQRPWRICR
jgi:hypothetical protein